MNMTRTRLVVIVSVAMSIVVFTAVVLYRPKRNIVIEVEGPANRTFDAIFTVDGRLHTQTVTLPKTITFKARDVSYFVRPEDKEADSNIKGHIFTDDGFADGSTTGWGVGGRVSCSNVLGIWLGDILVTNYTKEYPGPVVATR